MRRAKGIDALNPVGEPRWLVVRDRFSHVVHCLQLRPNTDLRTAMNAERGRRLADGWLADEIARNCAFFFCNRAEERVCVAIECYEPGTRMLR
jgi:hypothetical protein